jgi:hypothetical protein
VPPSMPIMNYKELLIGSKARPPQMLEAAAWIG